MRGAPSRGNTSLDQINSEIFTLTYGSFVRQLLADFDDLQEVHKQLEKIGHGIGVRLIDDFLSKTQQRCTSFRETAEVIAQQALPMFLNITADVQNWNSDSTECSLDFRDNPLSDFVELPYEYRDLKYSNILCGVIKGALEMVSFINKGI
eukprot:g9292.t1